jgi:hypothetical protein
VSATGGKDWEMGLELIVVGLPILVQFGGVPVCPL